MAHRILTVCTGNICRSPTAQQLLNAHLSSHDVTITSAGTHALVGSPMPDQALHWSSTLGGSATDEHRGIQLARDQITQADLVLALDRSHRRAVVEMHPPASRYCYTLLEFAHIAAHVTDADVEDVLRSSVPAVTASAVATAIAVAWEMRGVVPPLNPAAGYDVVDPYLARDAVYERSARDIETAVRRIAAFVDRLATHPHVVA